MNKTVSTLCARFYKGIGFDDVDKCICVPKLQSVDAERQGRIAESSGRIFRGGGPRIWL